MVRPPTRDSGPWNTIVALFEGCSFRTCGVELATASFRYETATKELTSWIHVAQDWLLVVAPVPLSQLLALFSFSLSFSLFSFRLFPCLLVSSNASNLFSLCFFEVLSLPFPALSFSSFFLWPFSSRGQEIARRAARNSFHRISFRNRRILLLGNKLANRRVFKLGDYSLMIFLFLARHDFIADRIKLIGIFNRRKRYFEPFIFFNLKYEF